MQCSTFANYGLFITEFVQGVSLISVKDVCESQKLLTESLLGNYFHTFRLMCLRKCHSFQFFEVAASHCKELSSTKPLYEPYHAKTCLR